MGCYSLLVRSELEVEVDRHELSWHDYEDADSDQGLQKNNVD